MDGNIGSGLVWGILFGIVGSGYFLYGKKQHAGVPMLCGFGLMVFPYFVSSTLMMVLVGAGLMAVPFLFRE